MDALFHICGLEVAELPLVATDTNCHGQVISSIDGMLPFSFLDFGTYSKLMNVLGFLSILVDLH
jgi:hypothetical protein